MNANDENSGSSIRKGKRRSSILKVPKSPGCALDDIDPNSENVDEIVQRSKKARRSSSRRVSFAETCQVKEIPNKVLEKMTDDFDENTHGHVPPSFLNLESTRDNSSYRPPASTLAGLSSLLTSPIQESPQREDFCEFSPDDEENELDFTCFQSGGNLQGNVNKTEDVMEMTKNYEGWEFEQSTVLTSRYSVSNKCSPEKDDGQLDFTRSHGVYIQDNQLNTTVPQDLMEMTRNYEGWEIEQSTVLTRQVVSSKVAISNHGQTEKLNASKFLDELKANDSRSDENFNGRSGLQRAESTFQTARSEPVQSPKRDGASFLNQLKNSSNNSSSYQPQQKDMYNKPSFADPHSTTNLQPIARTFPRTRPAQSPKRDGSSFLNQLKSTNNTSSYQPQQRNIYSDPTFGNAPPMSNLLQTMRSQKKEENLDFTQCFGNGIQGERLKSSDFTSDEMDMTGNYGNWQEEKSQHVYSTQPATPVARNNQSLSRQRSPEKSHELDFTQCHGGNIEPYQNDNDEDITGNQMEMTRNDQNWEGQQSYRMPLKRNDDISHKHSPERDDNLEFTRCQAGNIETSHFRAVDEDVTANQMEMTRNYDNWEQEESNIVPVKSKTPRNDSNLHQISEHSPEKDDNLEFTRCQAGNIETSQFGDIDEDTAASQMEMTRSYENWEQEKSNMVPVQSKTPRNDNNLHLMNIMVSSKNEDISTAQSFRLGEDLDDTSSEKTSRHVETSEDQASLMHVSRHVTTSDNQTSVPGVVNTSTRVKSSENGTSAMPMVNASRHVETEQNQTSMVKAVPRATSSRITMDKNFQRFEIKLPTSRIGKFPIYKSEEKPSVIKSEAPAELDESIASQTLISCAQDMTITTTSGQPSGVDVVENEPVFNDLENEVSPKTIIDKEQHVDSATVMDISTKSIQPEPNDTTVKSEQIETEAEIKKENIPEEKPAEKPYTLREFMSKAGISFFQHPTRRSETPMLKCDTQKELKDKIYSRSLSDAKLQIMENFCQQLQEEIAANEKLFAAKEKELNANNPPVFAKLKKVLGTDNEDLLVDVIKQLKRVGETRGKRLWYIKKKDMRQNVLASLQEQEKKLSDLSLINKHRNELGEDISVLDTVEADCDKQIQELEASLESEEKEWAEYVKDTDEMKQKLEALELELTSKEEQRARLSSVKESLTCEIAEKKTKVTHIESSIEKLAEEKTLDESKAEEIRKFLPFHTALQEWILEKYDETELKFTFLGRTLDLDVTFEDEEKIKDIQLISQISEISIPIAILAHKLIMEKFVHYDFLAMFPTRKKFLQLLHQVSLACIRVRILLETMTEFSINHIMAVNDKVLTVEFSSLAKFVKFILNFDLSQLVTHGNIPFTVVRKIGTTSADEITEKLNKFPSTIIYLSQILKAADQIIR